MAKEGQTMRNRIVLVQQTNIAINNNANNNIEERIDQLEIDLKDRNKSYHHQKNIFFEKTIYSNIM